MINLIIAAALVLELKRKSGTKENKLITVTSKLLFLPMVFSSPVPLKYHMGSVSWNGVKIIPALEELHFFPEGSKTKQKQQASSKSFGIGSYHLVGIFFKIPLFIFLCPLKFI